MPSCIHINDAWDASVVEGGGGLKEVNLEYLILGITAGWLYLL